uniref:Uncharacterized protein n=1 Tax=Oryza punctata TaxID=4537 RepID=A0A0E0KRV3_ORYPU
MPPRPPALPLRSRHRRRLPREPSIPTSDSDLDPESHGPADATLLRRRMRASAAEGNLAAALDALGRLRPAPATPDYNALLHAYLHAGQPPRNTSPPRSM